MRHDLLFVARLFWLLNSQFTCSKLSSHFDDVSYWSHTNVLVTMLQNLGSCKLVLQVLHQMLHQTGKSPD